MDCSLGFFFLGLFSIAFQGDRTLMAERASRKTAVLDEDQKASIAL
jgi:hypothetical protein